MQEKNIRAATVAKETGLSTGTISKYLSDPNKQPMFILMLKLASYFDVSPEWLYGTSDERKPSNQPKLIEIYEKLSTIDKKEVYDFACYLLSKENKGICSQEESATYDFPILGKTAAGKGIINGDCKEFIQVHEIPKGADFALKVVGDSMYPTIKDGSIIFVKHQESVENGEIAVIDIDGETICKKVYINDDGYEFKSINKNYEPIHTKNAKIIGKVLL